MKSCEMKCEGKWKAWKILMWINKKATKWGNGSRELGKKLKCENVHELLRLNESSG